MTPSKITSGQPISRKDYNALVDQSARTAGVFLAGGEDTDFGNPVMSVNLESEQGCWAMLTDYCRDANNAPLFDNGLYLYQWVQQVCDLGMGGIVWRNATTNEAVRGSALVSTGVYQHAAMELNNNPIVSPLENPRVWLYPAFLQFGNASKPDHRHVFERNRGRLLSGTATANFSANANFKVQNIGTWDDILTTPAVGNNSATITVTNAMNFSGNSGVKVVFSLVDLVPGNGASGNNATLGHGNFIQGFC